MPQSLSAPRYACSLVVSSWAGKINVRIGLHAKVKEFVEGG